MPAKLVPPYRYLRHASQIQPIIFVQAAPPISAHALESLFAGVTRTSNIYLQRRLIIDQTLAPRLLPLIWRYFFPFPSSTLPSPICLTFLRRRCCCGATSLCPCRITRPCHLQQYGYTPAACPQFRSVLYSINLANQLLPFAAPLTNRFHSPATLSPSRATLTAICWCLILAWYGSGQCKKLCDVQYEIVTFFSSGTGAGLCRNGILMHNPAAGSLNAFLSVRSRDALCRPRGSAVALGSVGAAA
jgi:hypothetical protein